jgi:hypothetical protein
MAVERRPLPGFELVGLDGNAFSIIGRFQRAARRAGMSREDIAEVRDEMMAGDYNHLLMVAMGFEAGGEDEDCRDCGEPNSDCECDEAFGRAR